MNGNPADWRNHENLLFAAGLSRRRRPDPDRPLAAAGLLVQQDKGRSDLDPLEARLLDRIERERIERQRRLFGQQETRRKWEQAVELQRMQDAAEERRAAAAYQRSAPQRQREAKLTDEQIATARAQRELASQQARRAASTPSETRSPEEIQRQNRIMALRDAAAVIQAQGGLVPDYITQELELLGDHPPPPSAAGTPIAPAIRQGLMEAATGDLDTAAAIQRARTQEELMKIPGVVALQNESRDALLTAAAKELDRQRPLLFGQGAPWHESGNPLSGAYWRQPEDDALKRATLLLEAKPEYRRFGITPQDVVDRYQGRGRFADRRID